MQYFLTDAIRLARHHRNINLIANGLCISAMIFKQSEFKVKYMNGMCINAFGLMFRQIFLYKLVHFQLPPLQLTALSQSINIVSAFCWLYPPSTNNLYSHLNNIFKSIMVSGATCVLVVLG